jgi:preprotein translocase subunit SecY
MRTFGNQIQKQGFGAGVELLIAMGPELVILALEISTELKGNREEFQEWTYVLSALLLTVLL